MNDQVKKAMEPLSRFWGNTSKLVKRLIVGGLIAVIVVALGLSILLNNKEYVILFNDISQTEGAEIMTILQEMQVDVKVSKTGEMMVLAEDEATVRMNLATQGYPKSGLSYSEENSGMLSTDYERRQEANRALQTRLQASIETLQGVKQAIVTITPPEENVFYLQEKKEPSASVIVHMKDDATLTDSQVQGILKLVMKGVAGLKKENIALTDGQGNELVFDEERNSENLKMTLTTEFEKQIKSKVVEVLKGPYDLSQFKVSVTATIDTDKLIREQLTYMPSPDGDNTGVINKENRSDESFSSNQTDGGVPGTTTNAEVPQYPVGGTNGSSTSTATSEQIEYLVSTIKEQTEKTGAYIDNVSIGIAIDKATFDPGEQDSIANLAAYAAGCPPENVLVQNYQFYKEEPQEEPTEAGPDRQTLIIGGAAGLLLLIVLLTIALLLRRKKKAMERAALEEAEALEREQLLAEKLRLQHMEEEKDKLQKLTPVKDARLDEIKEFAVTNPEIAAQMIRTWLKNEND